MTRKDTVLLPPRPGPSRPMPPWLGLVALLGLGVLGLSAIPAAWRRTALTRDLRQVREETGAQERRLLDVRRAVRDATRSPFARERALRRLLAAPPAGALPATGER